MILMKWISPFNQLLLLAFQLLTSQTGKNIINLEEFARFLFVNPLLADTASSSTLNIFLFKSLRYLSMLLSSLYDT